VLVQGPGLHDAFGQRDGGGQFTSRFEGGGVPNQLVQPLTRELAARRAQPHIKSVTLGAIVAGQQFTIGQRRQMEQVHRDAFGQAQRQPGVHQRMAAGLAQLEDVLAQVDVGVLDGRIGPQPGRDAVTRQFPLQRQQCQQRRVVSRQGLLGVAATAPAGRAQQADGNLGGRRLQHAGILACACAQASPPFSAHRALNAA
jgi:hypothetical protein